MKARGKHMLLATAVITLTAAGSTEAEVRVQKGLAGVTIGMTYEDVEAKLGEPLSSQEVIVEGGVAECCTYRFAGKVYADIFSDTGVSRISTTSRTERTARGVAFGSSLNRVRRAYEQSTCQRSGGVLTCTIAPCDAGQRETTVEILRNVVRKLEVSTCNY